MYMRGLEHPNPFNFNRSTQDSEEQSVHTPYGNSVVLNEIHNTFPAFLYDTDQFRNMSDVFRYVNTQMDERYNVFNRHRAAYRRTRPHYQRQQYSRNSRRQPVWQNEHHASTPHTPNTPQTPQIPQTANRPLRQTRYAVPYQPAHVHNDFLANLLASVIIQNPLGSPTGFSDPVLVIPTAEQLAAGTTNLVSVMNLESACAVCQDSMNVGQSVRRMNRCGHTFHTSCIDTWFQRNVHCPVCRHDIRETA